MLIFMFLLTSQIFGSLKKLAIVSNVRRSCSQASHMNFRTPLNAIINSFRFIEAMFKDENNTESIVPKRIGLRNKKENGYKQLKKFIAMGSNSSSLLLSLIDDILDLSKMERGTFTVNPTEFLIEETVKECYDIFYFQCLLKKIELQLSVSPEIRGLMVFSDSNRIKQALLNLLSNAFKFTCEGSIKIKVKFCDRDEKRFISMSVIDTGIGIKETDQKQLFKLFSMVSNQKLKNPNGSGIGLTVTRKYSSTSMD